MTRGKKRVHAGVKTQGSYCRLESGVGAAAVAVTHYSWRHFKTLGTRLLQFASKIAHRL